MLENKIGNEQPPLEKAAAVKQSYFLGTPRKTEAPNFTALNLWQ